MTPISRSAEPITAQRAAAIGDTAPLLSPRGVLAAFVIAATLSWPMLLVTAPLGYFDTLSYLQTGARTLDLALSVVQVAPSEAAVGADAAAGVATADDAGTVRQLRSFVYSAFLYLASLMPGGMVLATIIQTAATIMVLFAFVTVVPQVGMALAGGAVLAGLTTLPWFASYAMPDILAAAVILYFALLAFGISHVGRGWRITLALIATFAVVSHYGHIPLAFGLMLAALAACALRRSLTVSVAAMAILPVMLAVGLNLTASAVTLDGPSLAPKRLPILLARAIDDGPAAWHLRDACPEAGYAICDIFPQGVPDDISSFLWSNEGISSATPAELDAIRAEEGTIIWNAFRAYPVEQLASLLANTGLQMISIGTEHVNPLERTGENGNLASANGMRDAYPALAMFDSITFWGTLAATAVAALVWAAGLLPRGAGWALGVCLIGMFGNAFIFGGLSAPVDRYQSRVAWIFPALALVLWINQRGTPANTGAA
jgi:hypothetical protein